MCFDISEVLSEDSPPKKKLDDIMHLAELCIEVLQQNEEHHAEVSDSVLSSTVCHTLSLVYRKPFSYFLSECLHYFCARLA